jgi:hypothetical protein
MDTNWGLVADERINEKLDVTAFNSKKDYVDAVKNLLKQNHYGKNILNAGKKGKNKGLISFSEIEEEMFSGKASKKVESTQKRLEEFKKKETELPNKNIKQPDFYKFPKFRQKSYEKKPTNYLITASDKKLEGIRVEFHKLYGVKQYRDLTTGRYTKI